MKIFLVAVKSFANSLFETILEIMAISEALLNPGLPNGRRGGKDFQKKKSGEVLRPFLKRSLHRAT